MPQVGRLCIILALGQEGCYFGLKWLKNIWSEQPASHIDPFCSDSYLFDCFVILFFSGFFFLFLNQQQEYSVDIVQISKCHRPVCVYIKVCNHQKPEVGW